MNGSVDEHADAEITPPLEVFSKPKLTSDDHKAQPEAIDGKQADEQTGKPALVPKTDLVPVFEDGWTPRDTDNHSKFEIFDL